MFQCCLLCRLVWPACRRSSGEPVASVDVPVVAEHASVSVLGGRSVRSNSEDLYKKELKVYGGQS